MPTNSTRGNMPLIRQACERCEIGYCLVERLEDHDYLFAQNQ